MKSFSTLIFDDDGIRSFYLKKAKNFLCVRQLWFSTGFLLFAYASFEEGDDRRQEKGSGVAERAGMLLIKIVGIASLFDSFLSHPHSTTKASEARVEI